MKQICSIILTLTLCVLALALPGRAQHTSDTSSTGMAYDAMAQKAERFFANREWASAGAVYGIMLNERSDTPVIYGRAIVAAEMQADTLRVAQLLKQSMSHGVAFEDTFHAVETSALEVGDGTLYEHFLLQARDIYPYLTRPVNTYLLRYYELHNNGDAIVDYARRMLEGIPDNTDYLTILARGYLLQGHTQDAVDTWLRIVAVDPDNRGALLCLANYYMLCDKPHDALPYLRRASTLYPSPYLDKLLAKALAATDKKH